MMTGAARITMLSAALSRDGGGVYASILGAAEALADRGVQVSLVGLADSHSATDRPTDPRLASRLVTLRHRMPLGVPAPLVRAIADERPDVLHLHGLWLPPSRAMAGWRNSSGRPTVISPHGMLDPWALANSAWKKRLAGLMFERANLAAASCVHALNLAEAAALRAYGLRGPVAVIPNGVHLPPVVSAADAPAGDVDGRRVMLFLGRLHPKKGLAETIQAWSRLDAALRADWRLVIAGWDDGGHGAALRDLAGPMLASGDISFAGPLFGPAKEAALRGASAFILASHSEGLPMAVLEAWSHGKPAFLTAACNLPEGFAADAAIRVTPEPQALADALATHLGRADLPDLGARGRALVAERFSWPAVGARLAAVYDWLLGGGPMPADVAAAPGRSTPRRRPGPDQRRDGCS